MHHNYYILVFVDAAMSSLDLELEWCCDQYWRQSVVQT